MPGNIVQINSSKELEWYVGDSKMDALIEYLDKTGFRENRQSKRKKTTSSDASS